MNLSQVYEQKKELFLTSWSQAIPIYNKDRFDAVMRLRSEMEDKEPGLVIFGNYIEGISIREFLSNAKAFSLTKYILNNSSF